MTNRGTKEQSVFSPEASVIREELAKVLASDTFARSERLRRFLRFTVELRLAGKTAVLKEAVIGVEVFDRLPTYDPKSEPIVRIEARRLRKKLQQYYASEGSRDPAVIDLPRGGYVPSFELRENPAIAFPLPVVPAETDKPPARRSSRRWVWWTAALLAGLAAAGFRLLDFGHEASPLQVVPLTTYLGMEMHPSVSPDSKQVAFTWDGEADNFDIYVKLLDGSPPLRLTTNPAHDLFPTWSPDGREIAFLRSSPGKQEILAVPALGGPERRLAEVSSNSGAWVPNPSDLSSCAGPAWSPDGKSLLVVDSAGEGQSDSISLLSLSSGQKRMLTAPPAGQADSSPAFSPDGKSMAFVRASSTGATDVWVQAIGGGNPNRVTFDSRNINGIAWTRDGRRMVFASDRAGPFKLWSVPVSGGSPRAIDAAGNNVLYPSVSAAGLAYTEFLLNLNIWEMTRSVEGHMASHRLISSSRRNHSGQYAPDGRRIAFVSTRSGNEEIWICDAEGRKPQRLTSFSGPVTGTPRWSPSGDRIAFDSRVQGHSAIFTVRADGGSPVRLTRGSSDDSRPSWSRDGCWVYFTSNRGGSMEIWKLPAGGGDAKRLTHHGGQEPIESPDGGSLYYERPQQGLWTVPLTGGEEQPVRGLEALGKSRCWAVSEAGIYFIAESQPQAIQFLDFSNRQVSTVARLERRVSLTTPSLSVSPDGRSLLYAQVDERGSDLSLLQNFR